MSFWGRVGDLLSGQSAGSTDAAKQLSDNLDAQLRASNQQLVDEGIWTPEQAADADAKITESDSAGGLDNPGLAITEDFGTGIVTAAEHPVDALATGLQWEATTAGNIAGEVAGAASNGIAAGLGKFFKQIPWWVWIVVPFGLFLWLGGGFFLERKARKALSK